MAQMELDIGVTMLFNVPVLAEIRALKLSLELLWSMNVRKVLCEIDCVECEETLRDGWYERHVHADDFADVRHSLGRIGRFNLDISLGKLTVLQIVLQR